MENVCRLCANVKSARELMCSIEDETLNIVQKLIDCCRWNLIGGIECENLPQKICSTCLTQLENCWAFAERVAVAQQQLLAQIVEVKSEIHFLSCDSIENHTQDEFKDDVKIFENPLDYEYNVPSSLFGEDLDPTITEMPSDQLIDENETVPESIGYLCETCGKNFNSKSNLNTHTKLHLPLASRKHYECYICKTTFSYKKSLTQHIPTHWGQKIQHQCNVCQLQFSRGDALKRHSLIHLGKQPHLCATCGKGFRTKFNLKTHERTHTGDRPYACTYCSYRSGQGPNLGKHIKLKHKGHWQQTIGHVN